MSDPVTSTQGVEEFELKEMIGILLDKWFLIIFLMILTISGAAALNHFSSPVYEAKAEILVETSGGGDITSFFLPTTSGSDKMGNRLEIIKSPLVIGRAEEIISSTQDPNWAKDLEYRLTVSTLRDTDIINITVTGDSPEAARAGASAIAEAYKEYDQKIAQSQSLSIYSFLIDQVEQAEEKVLSAEMAVRDYQQEVGIISLSEEASKVNRHLTDLETDQVANEINIMENELKIELINEELEVLKDMLPLGSITITNQIIFELQKQLAELEGQRIDYLARGLSENSIEVRSTEQRIAGLEENIQEYSAKLIEQPIELDGSLNRYRNLMLDRIRLQAEITALENRADLIDDRIGDYELILWQLSDKAFDLARLQRDVEVTSRTYYMLVEELNRTRIAVERELGNVQVIRPATLPRSPISPRIYLNLAIGAILGLFSGVGIAFASEYLDTSLKDKEQLERIGLPILGAIPIFKDKQGKGATLILDTSDASDPLSLAYLRIETNLRFSNLDDPAKVLLITSAVPDEGKSTTLLNLAYTLAHSGQKVLIIDGDMRKPALHTPLNESKGPGLTGIVSGQVDIEDGIRKVKVNGHSFDFIPAGEKPPSILNLVRSKAFSSMLREFKETYDWVLVDTPPVQAASDSLEFADLVDGVVLVVATGKTPLPAVQDTLKQLNQVGAKILGAVMNLTSQKKSRYYGYSYNYYDYKE